MGTREDAVEILQSPQKGRRVDSSVSSGWEMGTLLLVEKLDR